MRPELWLLVCLGIVGIVFFFWKYDDSFPSASIDLKLTRQQIAERAADWSRKLGYDDKGAVVSTVFNPDEDGKTFLEYELGQAQANTVMKSEVPIWNWVTRFCRPLQMEDLNVGLGPDGSLHYFSHSLANDAPGTTIDHAKAQEIAKQYIEQNIGQSLAGWNLIKDAQTKQLHRTDHSFTWEDGSHDYKGGRLRMYLGISGDQVTDYSRFLHVPDRFERKYNQIRSYNLLLKQISDIVFSFLASAVAFIFVWALASGRIRWRLIGVVAVVAAVLGVLNWVDSIPSVISGYQTTMSFNQYLLSQVLSGLLGTLVSVIACVVLFGALEPIYRMAFPEKTALEKLLTERGLRSPALFRATVAGLATFGIHTAYVVAFYLGGQKIGFWSPMEIRETSTLSDLWPVFSAVNVGISASSMEELLYRVLALVIFKKLTRNFWLANLLQAASWAFMHSDYPQEPAYARGVELTIGGFFYGYILRSFGLPATLLAHYTYDAFLGVSPLLGVPSLADKAGALVAVLPGPLLLLAGFGLIKRRGKADDALLTNEEIPAARKKEVLGPPPDQHFLYQPLTKAAIAVCLIGGLLGAAVKIGVPLRTIGERNVVTISRTQAIDAARGYLQKQDINTLGMRTAAELADETYDLEMQYVFEKMGYRKTAELAKSEEPRLVWKVRFFKPMDPTEYYVALSPTGTPMAKTIIEEDEARGDRPTLETARRSIDDFLKTSFSYLEPLVLVDSTKLDRKSRTDYSLTYHVPKLKVADAEFEVATGTVGSMVSGLSTGWQIPESWKFERNKMTQQDQVFRVLRMALIVVLLLSGIWWLIKVIPTAHIRWRIPAALAVISAIIAAARQLNLAVGWPWDYKTEVTMATFITNHLANDAIAVLFSAATTGLTAAIALIAYNRMFPEQPVTSLIRGAWPHMGKVTAATRRMWLDAMLLSVGFTLLIAGADHLVNFGQYLTSPTVHMLPLGSISSLSQEWSAAVGGILSAFSAAIASVIGAAILAGVVQHFFGGSWKKLLAFGLVADLVANSHLRYMQDYVWTVLFFVVVGVLVWVFVKRLARCNILAYLFAGYFPALASTVNTLIRHERLELCAGELAALAVAFAVPLVYTAWLYLAPQKELDILPPDKVA
ncbi:MAG TPA: lysostaphin resistance A-like protein [Candidatus Obscuribacterales bacterium]